MIKIKFQKAFLIVACFVFLITLSACSKKTEEIDSGIKVTQDKVITDDVSYIEDNSEVTIKRNKVTKKSSIEMIYNIKDEEEYDDFFGENVTIVPMLFNMTCSMLTMSIFDPEGLNQFIEESGFEKNSDPKDEKMDSYLDGYITEKISIKFIDAETKEDIAYCESREAGNENIKVEIYRDYVGVTSLFGAEMGNFNTN